MWKESKTSCLAAAFVATLACAKPLTTPHLRARQLLGSSFGVPGDNVTYDYVIVGGGTAGLTLATRLAEENIGTVAVVEAGSFYEISNGNLSQVPATDGAFAGKGAHDWQPLIDWGYLSTPQVGAYNTSIHYARGKTLGGSSARNYMAYHRSTAGSYQMWADLVGDDSYSFENFLPFFEKSINFTPPAMGLRFANATPAYDITTMGTNSGPLSVTFSHYAQAFGTWALKGLKEMGFPVISGFQSGKLLGQSYSMFTINADTMTRDSSETSFLRQALQYTNYFVHPLTMAKKILFDDDRKATGVLVETQGFQYVLSARKEVILSAGVFGSPQLLMVSGVGPSESLQALDIPVVADRPGVGQNMQDHIYFGISYRVNAPTISSLQIPSFAARQAALYHQRPARGMYSNPITDVLAWEKVPAELRSGWDNSTISTLSTYPKDWPEVEYLSLSAYLGLMEDSRRGDPNDGFNYGSLAVALCTPRSRGTVTLSSADTNDLAIVNPNWLSEQADVDVAIAGFKRAREFFATDAMQSFVIGGESYPGSNVTTDAQIEEVIRRSFNTIYHAACTCSMGRADDPNAVVDTQGRVIGVSGLRVVDASTFPLLPPGHPMATVYGLAEKIACDITGTC